MACCPVVFCVLSWPEVGSSSEQVGCSEAGFRGHLKGDRLKASSWEAGSKIARSARAVRGGGVEAATVASSFSQKKCRSLPNGRRCVVHPVHTDRSPRTSCATLHTTHSVVGHFCSLRSNFLMWVGGWVGGSTQILRGAGNLTPPPPVSVSKGLRTTHSVVGHWPALGGPPPPPKRGKPTQTPVEGQRAASC